MMMNYYKLIYEIILVLVAVFTVLDVTGWYKYLFNAVDYFFEALQRVRDEN